ncbi:hypothetical protein [Algivirga pacifica]|uniref:Helix-turn-helix domain-containing protein n=1 Tax=Algivirga pacifica TaxID=1162670 RepID=A0ABP9DIF2_9BACT
MELETTANKPITSYFIANNDIFEAMRELNVSDKSFILYMFYLAVGDENGVSQYTNSYIAQEMSWSKRTVIRMKMELLQAGLISVKSNYIDKQQTADYVKAFYLKGPQNLMDITEEETEHTGRLSAFLGAFDSTDLRDNLNEDELEDDFPIGNLIQAGRKNTEDEKDIVYAFEYIKKQFIMLGKSVNDWLLTPHNQKQLEHFLTMYFLWGEQETIAHTINNLFVKHEIYLKEARSMDNFFKITGVLHSLESFGKAVKQ